MSAPQHVKDFLEEFRKLRRALDSSSEREKLLLARIREIHSSLTEKNHELELRSAVVQVLEKDNRKLEEEVKRMRKSEIFANEREENTKTLVNSLKQRVVELELIVERLQTESAEEILARQRNEEDELRKRNAEKILKRRTQHVKPLNVSPFERWKIMTQTWAPVVDTVSNKKFQKFAGQHPATPHAHEIALSCTEGKANS